MASPDQATDAELAGAVWDLGPLVDGEGDEGARRLITEATTRADAFATGYSGHVAELSAAELDRAIGDLAAISELLQRIEAYGGLRSAADSSDTAAVQVHAACDDALATVTARLLFFTLEWTALEDARCEALLAGPGENLAAANHYLRRLRARLPYLLGAPEERILAETQVQRLSAWQRLFSDNVAGLTIDLHGETRSLWAAIMLLFGPDRDARRAMVAAIPAAAESGMALRVAAYNQVLGDHAVNDRLRGYPSWLSARNLQNETTDASVQVLLDTVASRSELPRRWNRIKAQMFGVERIVTSDLFAPLPGDLRTMSYAGSRELIHTAWSRFSPDAAALIDAFFSEGRIDAPIRAHKDGGAFCASAGTERHPFVLANYDGRPFSTMMLAHELGHGLHFELARAAGPLQYETSIPMMEVASTFSESVVDELLLEQAADDTERLGLLTLRINDAMANVFECTARLAGEAAMHERRRASGELSAKEIQELWNAEHERLWGDSVEIEPGFMLAWSYLPHMIETPGYWYAYAYGLLTAWSIFAHLKQRDPQLRADYLAMLRAGGSRSPAELVAMVGLDVDDPGFWNAGLDVLSDLVDEAEALAARQSIRS